MSTTEVESAERYARNPGEVEQEVLLLPIYLLTPSKLNPRQDFDEAAMADLRNSMRMFGVLTALTVRKIESGDGIEYEIVAGERRFRAASDIGLDVVPVVVRNVSDRELVDMALAENTDREPLTAIDEAHAFQSLVRLGALQEEIAKRIRKDVSFISNTMRLLKLPLAVQGMVKIGSLTRAHGVALAGLATEELTGKIEPLAERAVKDGLTSRALEQEVAEIKRRHADALQPRLDADAEPPPPAATAVQSELTQEGDVVFVGNTTSPSAEIVAPVPPAENAFARPDRETDRQSAPPAPPAPAAPEASTNTPAETPTLTVVDRRSSAIDAAQPPPTQAAATASSTSVAPTPSATTAAPTASAAVGPMVQHAIREELDEWLWEQDLTVTKALEELRRFYTVASRLNMTGEAYLTKLEDEN